MVEGSCSLSPVLVFHSGPIFHSYCLNLNSSSLEDKDTLNNFVQDNGREFGKSLKRNGSSHEEERETNYNGICKWHDIVNTPDTVRLGQPLITGSKTLHLEEDHTKAKDDNDFYWIKRCLSAGSGEDIKTGHDGGRFKRIGRRMSDSLLHIHNIDKFRRSYACGKTADERAARTKGSLLKNWISNPLQIFNKNANPKSETTEKDFVASPRIGRKLLMPMLNRPRSYFDIFRGRRGSDPSFGCKIDQRTAECDKLTHSVECLSSEEDQTELHNEFVDVCLFKQEDIKIQSLLEKILRSHMLCMREYNPVRCDEASRNVTKLVTRLMRAMKETEAEQVKTVCQVFIGAVQDDGIFTAVQALWNQDWDNFASASFRNDAIFGLIVVFMIPC